MNMNRRKFFSVPAVLGSAVLFSADEPLRAMSLDLQIQKLYSALKDATDQQSLQREKKEFEAFLKQIGVERKASADRSSNFDLVDLRLEDLAMAPPGHYRIGTERFIGADPYTTDYWNGNWDHIAHVVDPSTGVRIPKVNNWDKGSRTTVIWRDDGMVIISGWNIGNGADGFTCDSTGAIKPGSGLWS